MTLMVYPPIPKPSYSYVLDHQLKTLVTDFESGTEQRNRRWRFHKRIFMLIYKVMTLTATERDALYEFYQSRFGSYEMFWYFDFQERKWIDQYVGQGSGVEKTFDLPGILSTPIVTETIGILTEAGDRIVTEDGDVIMGISLIGTLPIIYFNGIATTDFAYRIATGEGGVDQIVSGPPTGTLITIDFTGYLRIKGRFKDDKLTEELIESDPQNRFENLSISIYEVKN